jgi:GNAT superfamily N-acetyltransferase
VIRVLAAAEVDVVGSARGLARLHQGDGEYLVAWDEASPVGHVHATCGDPPEFQDLEVHDGARRRGVATALLAAARPSAARAARRGCGATLFVANTVGRSLYGPLGYRDVGTAPRRVVGTIELRTGPIEVDDTLLTLEKPLEP